MVVCYCDMIKCINHFFLCTLFLGVFIKCKPRICLELLKFVIMICNFADDCTNWFPASEMTLATQLKSWHPPMSRLTELASPQPSPPKFDPILFGKECLIIISDS